MHLINAAPDGAIISQFDYTYDSRGRRTSMTTLQGTWHYTYDDLGQLTGWTAPDGSSTTYKYDAMGNRVQVTQNGVTTSYTTNNLNQYTTVGGVTYTYDADGNLIRTASGSDVTTYSYDPENRLIAVTHGSDIQTYTYDALGNRVASTDNGVTAQYMIDPTGLGNVVGQYDGNGGLVARYDYGYGLVSRADSTGATAHYTFDAIGNTRELVGSSGQVLNRYDYTPFGQPLLAQETIPNPFQFVGESGVMTEPNGLDYMRSRLYDAFSGRFIREDSIGLRGGLNLYAYVGNDPIEGIDPTGLDLMTGICNVSSAAGGGGIAAFGRSMGGVWGTVGGIIAGAVYTILFQTFCGPQPPSPPNNGGGDGGGGGSPTGNERPVPPPEMPPLIIELPPEMPPLIIDIRKPPRSPRGGGGDAPGGDSSPGGGDGTGNAPSNPGGGGDAGTPQEVDPNSKTGPAGYGPQGFIDVGHEFPYRVDFENDPTATAPAQRVDVTDQLDPNLDWSTFALTEVGFGDNLITIPAGSQYYQTTVPMTYNGKTFDVEIKLGLKADTGQVYARFLSIDPNTELPPDVLTGFLPPENGTGRGEGYFSYTIQPKAGLSTGTQIRNVALITFGLGNTIATNQVDPHDPSKGTDPLKEALNTIDVGAPTSQILPLPATTGTTTFTVSWSGSDDAGGSGIATYDVFVSDNGGPFTPFQTSTAETSATFNGVDRHTYGFYSVATDNVGHRQATPSAAEATTTVLAQLPPRVQGVVINDGSAQRSMVTRLTVTFDRLMTLDPGAFEVSRSCGQ